MSKRLLSHLLLLFPLTLLAQEEEGTRNARSFTYSAGYANKQWITEMDGKTVRENFFGEQNKRLHGMTMQVCGYEPVAHRGLGLQYGVGFEFYGSRSHDVKERGWDSFSEFSMYFPLHLTWELPLSDRFALQPFAGFGFNWAITNGYTLDDQYYWDEEGNYYGPSAHLRYGHGDYPKHWNNQCEVGVNFIFSHRFILSATYSYGLTNHHLYDFRETRQDKVAITFGTYIR